MSDRLDRAFLVALALITLIYLFLFGYYLGATGLRVPVFDQIYWVLHYIDHWLTGDWWTYLWAPHNEHRIVWSRLLLVADLEWTGGTALPFLIFGLACTLILIGVVLQELQTSGIASDPRRTLALIAVLLIATSYNAIYSSVPQMGVFLDTSTFAVVALALWDGAGEGGSWAVVRRVVALFAAVGAAFGVSGGVLIWPVLHWAAWRGNLGLRWIVVLWLIGGLLIAVYVHGLYSSHVVAAFDAVTLLRMADYVLRFLGLPWSHSPHLVNLGRAAGLAVLGFGGYAILRFGFLNPPRSRLERMAIGLLLFSFMMAALIAVGRLDTAPEREMPIRYALFTSLAQVGLLLFAAPTFARFWTGPRRRLLQALLLAGGVLFLGQQVLGGQAGVETIEKYTMAYRDFDAGRYSPDLDLLVGDRRSVERVLAYIHAHRLYHTDR